MKVKGCRGRGHGCCTFWMKANSWKQSSSKSLLCLHQSICSHLQPARIKLPHTHTHMHTDVRHVSESFGTDTQCWMYSFGVSLYVGLRSCLLELLARNTLLRSSMMWAPVDCVLLSHDASMGSNEVRIGSDSAHMHFRCSFVANCPQRRATCWSLQIKNSGRTHCWLSYATL